MELKFYLNPVALFFTGEANPPAEEVQLNAEDTKLTFHLCVVSLNPTVYMSMMSMMTKTPAKYPTVRIEMRQFPLDNGATFKEIINPFNGKVPQRIVLGILQTTAFNSQYDKDPFAFEKAGAQWIKQIWNGEEYPYEMDLNTGNEQKDLAGYHRFWMPQGVCTEVQETWCDLVSGVLEKLLPCLHFQMWPMVDTTTPYYYLEMRVLSTSKSSVQPKEVRKPL